MILLLIVAGLTSNLFVPGEDKGSLFSKLLYYPVVAPATILTNSLENGSKFSAGILHSGDIAARNRQLETELAIAKLQASKSQALQDQMDQIRRLKGLLVPIKNKHIWVSVIGFDPNLHRMILNGGQDKGIEPNRAVICSTGLIGIVRTVDKHSCTIELVSSPSLRIGAMLMDAQYTAGLIKGQGGNTMKMGMLERNVSVPAGTQVVTSVHSELIPPWIPIGRVINQQSTPEFGIQEINVQMKISFGSVKDVAVLQ